MDTARRARRGSQEEEPAMYARIDRSRQTCEATARPFGATKRGSVLPPLARALSILDRWQERWRQRRQLEALDDRALNDLALSRADIHREASKPFWLG